MANQVVKVSDFTPRDRVIAPPASFNAEPFVVGNVEWGPGRVRIAYALWGANDAVTALSPYTEINLAQSWQGLAIRISELGSRCPAMGFVAAYQFPDAVPPFDPSAWYLCKPENGANYVYGFGPGDLRLGGQRLIADVYHNEYLQLPRGAQGIDGAAIDVPLPPPTIRVHGAIAPGTYYIGIGYILPDGRRTPVGPVRAVTLTGNQRAILCHRREAVPQGVVGIYVAMGVAPDRLFVQPRTYPRNFVTWYVSEYVANSRSVPPPVAPVTWRSNPLVEALDSDAGVVFLDIDVTVDAAPVIPYKPTIANRLIRGDAANVIVTAAAELLTVSASNVWIDGIAFGGVMSPWGLQGGNTTEGVNFCDYSGGQAFHVHFTRCVFIPSRGYWLCVDDAAGMGGSQGNWIMTNHTASEIWFDECYAQREAYISGNQSVDFFFERHRQDVLTNSVEAAAFHLMANKFVTFDYLGVDNAARAIFHIGNGAGPIAIDVTKLYVDKHVPTLIAKDGAQSAVVSLRFGTMNRETPAQSLVISPNAGQTVVKVDSFIAAAPTSYAGRRGAIQVIATDPREAAAFPIRQTSNPIGAYAES